MAGGGAGVPALALIEPARRVGFRGGAVSGGFFTAASSSAGRVSSMRL